MLLRSPPPTPGLPRTTPPSVSRDTYVTTWRAHYFEFASALLSFATGRSRCQNLLVALPSDFRQALADTLKKPLSAVQDRVVQLQEVNPMLGFRGCRQSVVYPEITEMQARAVAAAAAADKKVGK